jgi:hypothetical protein
MMMMDMKIQAALIMPPCSTSFSDITYSFS